MKKFRFYAKALSMLLVVMFVSSVAASCGGEDDEPQPVPEPEPEAIDPLVIKTTTLCGYDWNGYNESSNLCMMEIKSTDNNPQISANSSESWVTTYVAKGADGTDADGYYTFYVMANIDKNDSETARDFKIKVSAKVNYNGSTISESESCSCTQYGYITIDDFVALNEKVAKWQLRSEVAQIKTSDNPEITYIKNDYYDPGKFLYRPEVRGEEVLFEMGNTRAHEITLSGMFLGENLDDTFLGFNPSSDYYFTFVMEESSTTENSNTTFFHFQVGLISISEKELILEYYDGSLISNGIYNQTRYSFYFTALE